jgi:hypothetical protein
VTTKKVLNYVQQSFFLKVCDDITCELRLFNNGDKFSTFQKYQPQFMKMKVTHVVTLGYVGSQRPTQGDLSPSNSPTLAAYLQTKGLTLENFQSLLKEGKAGISVENRPSAAAPFGVRPPMGFPIGTVHSQLGVTIRPVAGSVQFGLGPMFARPDVTMMPPGTGMTPVGQGMRPTGPAVTPTGPGMMPAGPGMMPAGPGMRPTGPAVMPAGPGMTLAGTGIRPAGPATMPPGPAAMPPGPGTIPPRSGALPHSGKNFQFRRKFSIFFFSADKFLKYRILCVIWPVD